MSQTFVFESHKLPETSHSEESAVAWALTKALEFGQCAVVWLLSKRDRYTEAWAYTTITSDQAANVDRSDLRASYRIQKFIPELMSPREFHVYVLKAVEVRIVQTPPEVKT